MSDQALKKDAGKVRLHLVPRELREAASRAFNFGTQKYSRYAWVHMGGMEWTRLFDGLNRHLDAWVSGEDLDPESGLAHLDHAAACLAMLLAHIERGLGTDDRYTTDPDPDRKDVKVEDADEPTAFAYSTSMDYEDEDEDEEDEIAERVEQEHLVEVEERDNPDCDARGVGNQPGDCWTCLASACRGRLCRMPCASCCVFYGLLPSDNE